MPHSYTNKTSLDLDSAAVDAFGRARVSNEYTLFNHKQLLNSGSFYFDHKFVSGATGLYQQAKASTLLTVSTASNSQAIRQTKQSFYYQAGKSFKFTKTFNMHGHEAGIIKRVGYFNENNGVFLELSGSSTNLVIRSNSSGAVVENKVSQSAWNADKLESSHPGKNTLDLTKMQLFSFDLQWLGAGRVRTGFFFDGEYVLAHEFLHTNIVTATYLATPNLPVRTEILNADGVGTGSLSTNCVAITSEGGFQPVGINLSFDRDFMPITIGTTNITPVLSVRLQQDKQGTIAIPLEFDFFSPDTINFRWCVYVNPTFAGTDNASWIQDTNSAIEYDISRDATNTVVSGVLLKSGYATSNKRGTLSVVTGLDLDFSLGYTIDGVSDEIVLCVQNLAAGSNDYYAATEFRIVD
jgi:hypothetical protein